MRLTDTVRDRALEPISQAHAHIHGSVPIICPPNPSFSDSRPASLTAAARWVAVYRTRKITWAEMALLRLLTHPPYRWRPAFGNPPGLDFKLNR